MQRCVQLLPSLASRAAVARIPNVAFSASIPSSPSEGPPRRDALERTNDEIRYKAKKMAEKVSRTVDSVKQKAASVLGVKSDASDKKSARGDNEKLEEFTARMDYESGKQNVKDFQHGKEAVKKTYEDTKKKTGSDFHAANSALNVGKESYKGMDH